MKVGIITLFHDNYNYGAALQAFALQKAIESIGNEAEIIDYDRTAEPIDATDESTIQKIKRKFSTIHTFGDIYDLTRIVGSKQQYWDGVEARKEGFARFYSKYMKVSKYYNLGTISSANQQYDAFVCGSDQVWRPSSFDPNFFLAFADQKKKKISYAASLGVKKLSTSASQKIVPLINDLDALSVREKEACDLLREHGLKTSITLDPTLLWDKSFWNSIAVDAKLTKKKYILSYLIGENNVNRVIAKKISKKLGLRLVAIPGVSRYLPYDFKYADINMVEAAPDEFIGLIRDAAFVVTDSFHACVFSTIFETPFVALERFAKNDVNSMNGRIYNFLQLFGLENQLIHSGEVIDGKITTSIYPKHKDYNKQREFSWLYLKNNLPIDFITSKEYHEIPMGVYAVQTTNKEIRKNSSSGGVFYELAHKILSENGVVVACKLNDLGKAVHDACFSIDELHLFMTSKYVQSDMSEAVKIVNYYLKNRKKVLFVGTPCQTAGLMNYLCLEKINTENLICVDFICHGVPSPYVWQEYLKGISYNHNAKAVKANFRNKRYGWRNFSMLIEIEDSVTYLNDKENDLFLQGFLNNLFLRPSCYNCHFKTLKHDVDITLGDFWHFENVESTIKDDNTGVSLVITQSQKGDSIIHDLETRLLIDKMPLEIVSKANKNMFLSAKIDSRRSSFFTSYELFKKKYKGSNAMQIFLKNTIHDSLITRLKKKIKKIRRGKK